MRLLILTLAFAVLASPVAGQATDVAREGEVRAVVEAFHGALEAGDSVAALAYLHPDVVIYEGGHAFRGSEWIPPVLGTAVFFYGGLVFLKDAWREIQDRLPGMMTLISLAITVAFVFCAAVTLGYPGMPLWEELATLVTILLLGAGSCSRPRSGRC